MSARFVHLHTHSHYSLLDGLGKIDDLVARAKELGMDSLAITDHGNLYGAVEFYKKATKAGIKPILGVEAYIAPHDRFLKDASERYYHLVLLAENLTGWQNLIKLVSKAHLEGYYYKPRMDKALLREHSEGLIALSACIGGEVNSALLAGNDADARRLALEYQDIFGAGNFFMELQTHPNLPEAVTVRERAIALARELNIPVTATADLHYVRPEDAPYHDVLLAVQTGTTVDDDNRMSMKQDDFSMKSPDEMASLFADVPDAISNTVLIAERCNVTLDLKTTHLPEFPKPDDKDANAYLAELIAERIESRYPDAATNDVVRDRVAYELGVISATGFADYFLIVQDLVSWARDHGISVGPGRGSAAGSITSYILGITDVDPIHYGLLFERFLNPERIQMPDIDLDFADSRRDEVLAYAREKYGTDHVAQIITFGTMAARASIRDAGRAMGFSYAFCDMIAKLIPFNPNAKTGIQHALDNVPEVQQLYQANLDARRLLDTALHLEGVVRHASVHACGTVVAKEPLTEMVPVQFAPQDKNVIITQFEMHAVEDLGLLKIDFLGLRNLTTIQETLRLVREIRGEDVDISSIPLDDPATFELLRRGDTTGVFQFESAGMRRYMRDIKPNTLDDLVALVALYRPGPMDLIPSFIARKHGEEKITYLHPRLEPILKDTYGIGVYQEQMMRIATDLAGYTLPEADTLRKAIGKKIKELLDEQSEKLVAGMIRNGIDDKTAKAIWELFPPFARYGFNKSHAVCYALIGYRTAYLKAHYPEEFTASLFNADKGEIERTSFLVQEAKQASITVLGPDVNASDSLFIPEGDMQVRFGLSAIKNVGTHICDAIVAERAERGPYVDMADFFNRVVHKDLNKKSLESLIKAGVFDSLGTERMTLLTNIDQLIQFASANRKRQETLHNSLFGSLEGGAPAPTLSLQHVAPATSGDRTTWEKELLGFYLSDHPLEQFKNLMVQIGSKQITEIRASRNENEAVKLIGLVSQVKKIVTKKGDPMVFATLEDYSPEPLEVVVFSSTFQQTLDVWAPNNVVAVLGRMSYRNDEPKFICEKAKVLQA